MSEPWWDRFYKALFFHMVVNKSHQPSPLLGELLTALLLLKLSTWNHQWFEKVWLLKYFLIVCKCIGIHRSALRPSHYITRWLPCPLKCCFIKLAIWGLPPLRRLGIILSFFIIIIKVLLINWCYVKKNLKNWLGEIKSWRLTSEMP